MTTKPHDRFAKQFLQELLSPLGEVSVGNEVTDEARFVDVLFSPTPTSAQYNSQFAIRNSQLSLNRNMADSRANI